MSLRYGILGLLLDEPMHGYEIRSRFEELLGGSWEVNIGHVYMTLQRLERDRLVEPAGDRGGRRKQAYRLTEEGRLALQAWLDSAETEPLAMREGVYLKLLLARKLAVGHPNALLAKQRHVYLQRLKDLAELELRARRERRPDLALLYRSAILHTEADLKWVDACAEEIREAWSTAATMQP